MDRNSLSAAISICYEDPHAIQRPLAQSFHNSTTGSGTKSQPRPRRPSQTMPLEFKAKN